jgi:plasmid stabilization system protein ParE
VIEFHQLARNELREAVKWYRDHAPQVAERLVAQVDRAVERIASDPESHPVIGRIHRYVRVSRFPYLLVFHISDSETVVVTAVAHTSRRPGYWKRRQ